MMVKKVVEWLQQEKEVHFLSLERSQMFETQWWRMKAKQMPSKEGEKVGKKPKHILVGAWMR